MNRRDVLKLGGVAAAGLFQPLAKAQAVVSGIVSPVLTRAVDNSRTGANLAETVLTPASVAQRGIRKYFSLYMEGDARGTEGQVLTVPSVRTDDGTVRDLAVVASMNNTVWCYDANSSDILWVRKVAKPVNGSAAIDMHTINDHWGILSTGVIDPDTLHYYCVAWSSPNGDPATAAHSVHVLDLRNGNRIGQAVSLEALTYQPPNLPLQLFKTGERKQRSALLLTKVNGVKTVFFASGSVLETTKGASGWIIGFDVATQRVSATLAMSSRYYGAGIWMGGQGLCADDAGFLYGVTGNGGFDGATDFAETIFKVQYTPPAANSQGALKVVDWWTPYTDAGRVGKDPTLPTPQSDLELKPKLSGVSAPTSEGRMPVNMMHTPDLSGPRIGGRIITKPAINTAGFSDEDLGSAGLSLIPEYGIALSCGKDGIAYEVNLQNMGKTRPADFKNAAANYAKLKQPPVFYTYYPCDTPNCVPPVPTPQDPSELDFVFEGRTHHLHSTSVRYKSSVHGMMLFCGGENGNIRAFTIAPNGTLTFLANSAEAASPNAPVNAQSAGGMTGWMMSLSANGDKPGTALLWALMPYGDANATVTGGRLLCYDPENFGTFQGGAKQLRVLWDSQQWNIQFSFPKFDVPTISGGKVFVPTYDGRVDVYGLA